MKKLVLPLALLGSCFSFSQEVDNWCGFDEHNEMLHQQYPGSKQSVHEQIMRYRDDYINNHSSDDRTNHAIIPCVVHVIHDGGSSNISYDQIVSAIDQLSEDFQMLNSDAGNARNTAEAPFAPLAADMQFEFKLAKIDPQGNCTNGVERRLSPDGAVNADDGVKFWSSGGMNAWPRDEYLNIWVVESIESGGQGITLGYAQFPYFGQASTYGLVIRHDAFGTMGTANGDRTLTHEVGHCFGLFHPFQDGCHTNNCNDNADYCCDTPPVDSPQWSCSTSQNTCTQVPTNDAYGFDAWDQFENFMSYSPCQYMFSEDQKSIVQGNFANIGFMQDLASTANATATGVNQPDILCQAEFSSSTSLICAGGTVDFSDESYFGVTGVTWTFNGGSPASSTDPSPTVTYNTPGVYSVTLEATDGTNTVTKTETDYIIVLDNPGVSLPYFEGFESYSALPDNTNWLVENEDGGQTWKLQANVGHSGTQSAKLSNFGLTNGSKDHLMSGPIDLSGVSPTDNIVFNFKYAYRKRSASNDEWLRFYISDDCGETWTLRKNIHGNDLSDMTETGSYVPADASEWYSVDITNINSPYYLSNFRFKFEFENDNGNNIYIDDINLYPGAMTNIVEPIADNLSVYPNPVSNNMQITMDVYDTAFYTVTLTNALGQQVAVVYQGEIQAGNGQLNFDSSGLPAGMYFLNVESNGNVRSTKVMKQ